MSLRSTLAVLLLAGCGNASLVSTDEAQSASADELNVSACFQQAHQWQDFLDGGVANLEACLADAGLGTGLPPPPSFDGGLPSFPSFDGGWPPFPSFDGGLPPFPSFDGGLPPFPSFDGGLPPFPSFDGGLPPFPSFDGGLPGVPPGLLSSCSASCTCPAGLQCLNPLGQTCPGSLTLCIP